MSSCDYHRRAAVSDILAAMRGGWHYAMAVRPADECGMDLNTPVDVSAYNLYEIAALVCSLTRCEVVFVKAGLGVTRIVFSPDAYTIEHPADMVVDFSCTIGEIVDRVLDKLGR